MDSGERIDGMVIKRVKIPEDDADWFENTYPMYGAWTWFVQSCLAKFREAHDTTPEELIELGLRELEREAYEQSTSSRTEGDT